MKATIKIVMDNAAFEDSGGTELARILRDLADKSENSCLDAIKNSGVYDINGNKVGTFKVTE